MRQTMIALAKALQWLECPACHHGALELNTPDRLACARCGSEYPIVRDVPRFVADEHHAGSFGLQWNRHQRTQLDSYTERPISRDWLFQATNWPDDLRGHTVLEAGSGAGRFTEVLAATGAHVLSFDLSVAVDANQANNGHRDNVLVFQAEIGAAPVRRRSMDKVLCLGVLQHTPRPAAAFQQLAEYVKPGGELVIDVYAARLRSVVGWKYVLRPLTRRMDRERLYRLVASATPRLMPVSAWLYRVAGRAGSRLLPIVQYAHWGLPAGVNREWAVLNTFDMYAPAHDRPQTLAAVRRWYREAGLTDVTVEYGANGVVGRGRRPASP